MEHIIHFDKNENNLSRKTQYIFIIQKNICSCFYKQHFNSILIVSDSLNQNGGKSISTLNANDFEFKIKINVDPFMVAKY